ASSNNQLYWKAELRQIQNFAICNWRFPAKILGVLVNHPLRFFYRGFQSMVRLFSVAAAALIITVAPASAAELTGKYVEARTCDVYTAPCFANAEMNLAGKHAVMGWRVDQGAVDGVKLDGLSVVAVVAASDTLG